jgi:hypothetical protein
LYCYTNLSLTQGGRLDASTLGQGDAGAITIEALDTISADGEDREGNPSGIISRIESEVISNSGGININTNNLSLTQGGVVSASTFGRGNAGAITIEALGTISVDGETQAEFPSGIFSIVIPTGVGDSGQINITTTNLSLTQGGLVSASTLGQGDAGAITIEASGTISADGEAQAGFSSGIISIVTPTGVGDSRGINITTRLLITCL